MKKHIPIIILSVLIIAGTSLGLLTSCDNATAKNHLNHVTAISDTVVISQLNDAAGTVVFKEKKGPSYSVAQYTPNAYYHYYLEFDTTGADTFKIRNLESSSVLKYWTTAQFYVRVATPNSTVGNSFNVQNFTNWSYFTRFGGSDSTLNLTTVQRDSAASWGLITSGQTVYNTTIDSLQVKKSGSGFYTIH